MIYTLDDAKQHLRERWEAGADCPCCGRFTKLYKRKLNSGMAAALVLMFRWHGRHGFGEWFSTADLLFRGHRLDADFSKLRFWGLIERHPEGAHRLYRITPAGVDFVGGGQVRKYTYTFDDRAIRRKNPDRSMITIRESLGDRFSLEELMRATPDGS